MPTSTKYNINDLHEGNVSADRFREIVHEAIAKVDPRVASQADLYRTANILLDISDKQITFNKKALVREKAEVLADNEEKDIELGVFNNTLVAIEKFLELIEEMIEFNREKELEEKIELQREIYHSLAEDRRIQVLQEQAEEVYQEAIELQEREMNERYQQSLEQIKLHHSRMGELANEIIVLQKRRKELRQAAVENFKNDIRDLTVDSIKVFEGKSPEEMQKISEELLRAHVSIDHKILDKKDEIKKIKEDYFDSLQGRPVNFAMQSWNNSKAKAQCEKIEQDIQKLEDMRPVLVGKVLANHQITLTDAQIKEVSEKTYNDTVKNLVQDERPLKQELKEKKKEYKDTKERKEGLLQENANIRDTMNERQKEFDELCSDMEDEAVSEIDLQSDSMLEELDFDDFEIDLDEMIDLDVDTELDMSDEKGPKFSGPRL